MRGSTWPIWNLVYSVIVVGSILFSGALGFCGSAYASRRVVEDIHNYTPEAKVDKCARPLYMCRLGSKL